LWGVGVGVGRFVGDVGKGGFVCGLFVVGVGRGGVGGTCKL